VIDLSLHRIERLLAALGNPEASLPPVLHMAGTNGKGSSLAFLRAMLEAARRSVHLYTSPHLVRFNERIVLAGEEIGDAELAALLEECEAANDGAPITFFEFTTAVAYLAFSRTEADILLLETGLGGRLDATNVIDKPALTAIAPVSQDHQGFLGDDLGGIAAEKAGILKSGATGVIARQPPAALAAIEARAKAIGAPLYRAGVEWTVARRGDELVYAGGGGAVALPLPALAGEHQLANAGLALACLDCLDGVAVGRAEKARGVLEVRWPGRLQRLDPARFGWPAPAGWEVWLDGGHNPEASTALAAWTAAENACEARPLYLITALLETKDAAGFLRPLAAHASTLRTLAPKGEHAFIDAGELAEVGLGLGLPSAPADDVAGALRDLATLGDGRARVLICGSLYLAGEILAALG